MHAVQDPVASGHRRLRPATIALASLIAATAVVTATTRAWLADDAYITFRYVDQFLAGNGLVYNAGERVEGFTHPLWAMLLVLLGLLRLPPAPASLLLGLSSAGALVWLALRNDDDASRPHVALGLTTLVGCSGVIDFATSGLETPLTMLLVFVAFRPQPIVPRAGRVGLCLGLAYLCHPDVAVLALGPILLMLAESSRGGPHTRRALLRFVAALAIPPLGWHAFRLAYYGSLLPNTYAAKNGGPYWSQGLAYIADFVSEAPVSAAGLGVLVLFALRDLVATDGLGRWRRSVGVLAIVAHALSVARLGGDFMGFRLLLPDLAAAAALLGGGLAGRVGSPMRTVLQVGLTAVALHSILVAAPPDRMRGAIANERVVYQGAFPQLRHAFLGQPRHLWWFLGKDLRRFQRCLGEPAIVVEFPHAGYFGYAAGTRASVIDGVGLVDRFIARNWSVREGLPRGRPGHEGKMTLDYALQRGIHFGETPFGEYNTLMRTKLGPIITLDPRIVCALPGKADALRALRERLLASDGHWDRRMLEFLARMEVRDRSRVETLCQSTPTPSNGCSARILP